MLTNVNSKREKLTPINDDIFRSKAAVAGGRGRPFRKGEDPRRHKLGRVSLDRAAFVARFNDALVGKAGDPEELARILWKYARAGRPWAISEILNRICGKQTQLMEPSEVLSFEFSLKDFKESLHGLEENETERRS